jgi:hypothetical protein
MDPDTNDTDTFAAMPFVRTASLDDPLHASINGIASKAATTIRARLLII